MSEPEQPSPSNVIAWPEANIVHANHARTPNAAALREKIRLLRRAGRNSIEQFDQDIRLVNAGIIRMGSPTCDWLRSHTDFETKLGEHGIRFEEAIGVLDSSIGERLTRERREQIDAVIHRTPAISTIINVLATALHGDSEYHGAYLLACVRPGVKKYERHAMRAGRELQNFMLGLKIPENTIFERLQTARFEMRQYLTSGQQAANPPAVPPVSPLPPMIDASLPEAAVIPLFTDPVRQRPEPSPLVDSVVRGPYLPKNNYDETRFISSVLLEAGSPSAQWFLHRPHVVSLLESYQISPQEMYAFCLPAMAHWREKQLTQERMQEIRNVCAHDPRFEALQEHIKDLSDHDLDYGEAYTKEILRPNVVLRQKEVGRAQRAFERKCRGEFGMGKFEYDDHWRSMHMALNRALVARGIEQTTTLGVGY